MRGDFTRSTHDPRKHYSGVRMQQGRVQLDSDWNEQVDIQSRLRETALCDVIGRTGAPRLGGGFRIGRVQAAAGNYPDLYVTPGRYYVDGILCELDPPAEFAVQSASSSFVTLAAAAVPALAVNETIEILDDAGQSHAARITAINNLTLTVTPELPSTFPIQPRRNPRLRRVITFSNQYSTLPAQLGSAIRPALPTDTGTYFVYLDSWQRHVTASEDASIRETALGGPDTATRTQSFWQVRMVQVTPSLAFTDFEGEPTKWSAATAPSTGRMSARTSPALTSADPCIVPAGAGYTRLENQLYRVEVHAGGTLSTATFKWSRDNGSVVTEWLGQDATNPNRLFVRSAGPDGNLGFAAGQWVELTDDTREVDASPGVFVEVVGVEANALTVAPPAGTTIRRTEFPVNPKIRRWDMGSAPKLLSGGWLALEGGVEVRFEAGSYRTGEYWLIPARSFTGELAGAIEWPQDANGPVAQLPQGPIHRYTRLAAVTWDGSSFQVAHEYRPVFSAITDQVIAASQVTYDRGSFTDLPASVNTVQLAIDEAFRRAGLRDNAIRITQIRTEIDSQPLDIDTLINVSRLTRGIRISCDQDVSSMAFSQSIDATSYFSTPKPNVALIFDIPYPLRGDTQWSVDPFGLQAIEINGTVSVSGRDIIWVPTSASRLWMLNDLFNRLLNINSNGLIADPDLRRIADQVRVRLVLKGNFIFGTGSQEALLYLDGEAFGQPMSSRVGLATPAGDGRRGGDFEMWFWVRRGHELGLTLGNPPNTSSLPPNVTGRVSITPANGSPSPGAGVPDVTINLLNLSGNNILSTTRTSGAMSSSPGSFDLALAISGSGTYLVQATSGSVAEVRTLYVPPPKFGTGDLVAPPDEPVAQSLAAAPKPRKRGRKKAQEPES